MKLFQSVAGFTKPELCGIRFCESLDSDKYFYGFGGKIELFSTHNLLWNLQCLLLRAKADAARLSHRNSACPSVTIKNGASQNLHRQLPGRLVLGTIKLFSKFEGGHPERGRYERGGENLQFLANKPLCLSNGAR